jgi:hypothetical protein
MPPDREGEIPTGGVVPEWWWKNEATQAKSRAERIEGVRAIMLSANSRGGGAAYNALRYLANFTTPLALGEVGST